MILMRRRGQSTLEITLMIVALVSALVAMFPSIRSAVSERYKRGADRIGGGLLYNQGGP